MSIQLVIKNKLVKKSLNEHEKYNINATIGEKYNIIDTVTGKTPKDLKVYRDHDNLVLKLVDEDIEVVIQGFWSTCSKESQCFAELDVQKDDDSYGTVIITQVDHELSGLVAGEIGTLPESYNVGWWILGGGLLAGGIAAAVSAGGSSSNGDKNGEKTETNELPENGGKNSQGSTNEPNGEPTDPSQSGNGGGNSEDPTQKPSSESDGLTLQIDPITPDKTPTITGKTNSKDNEIEVIIRDQNGNEIVRGNAQVDDDGSWSYTPDKELPIGKNTINVIAKDKDGNKADNSIVLDLINTKPSVIFGEGDPNDPQNADKIKDANNGDRFFDEKSGNIYELKDNSWELVFTHGEDGKSATLGEGDPSTSTQITSPKEGDTYWDLSTGDAYVYQKNENGNLEWHKFGSYEIKGDPGEPGKDGQDGVDGKDGADGKSTTVGRGEPTGEGHSGDVYVDLSTGDIYTYGDSGWAKTGEGETNNILDHVELVQDQNGDKILSSKELGDDAHFATVKIYLKEGAKAGDMVVVNGANGFTLTATDIENGFVEVPVLVREGENSLNIIAYNAEGQKNKINDSFNVDPSDTTAPDEATNVVVAKDGDTVTGSAEPGSTVTIKDADGKVIGTGKADEKTGDFSVAIEPAQTNGETLTVVVSDAANNASAGTTVNAQDSTAPAEATNVVVAKDGDTVTGSAEPGSTVTIKDADGKVIGTGKADAESGDFSVAIEPAQTNGETLTVVVSDAANNASAGTTVNAQDSTAPAEATNVVVAKDGNTVTGNAEPGSTVTIKDADGKVIGTGKADEKTGDFSVAIEPAQTNGETLTVVVSDAANNASAGTTVNAQDSTAPDEATNVVVAKEGNTVTGNAEPGSTVTIKDADGKVIGTGKADAESGDFSVAIEPAQTNGETLTVVVSDAANNASAGTTVNAQDSTAPAEATNVVVAKDGDTVTGSAEPGSTVTIKDADGKVIGTGKADEKTGDFSVAIEPAQTNGETLMVVVSDAANNASAGTTVNAQDSTAPAEATNVVVAKDGNTVTGNAEPGSTVTIKDADGKVIGTGKADAESGNFSVAIEPAQTNGETLMVVVSDAANNASAGTTVNAQDSTAPAEATNVVVAKDGDTVTGNAEPGSTVTIKDADGKVIGTGKADAESGDFSVAIEPAQTNGETLTVVVSDASGNASQGSQVQAQDTTAPDEATNIVVAKDGNTVTGNAEPGSTVTIKDADGKVIGTGKADAESGDFSVAIEPAQTNGETLTVVVSDASGNASQGSQVQAQDTTAPDEATNIVVAKDGNTVTGNAEPGSTVTIKDADGKVIGTDKADEKTGDFSVAIEPAQANGETLTVVVSDASGNASQGSQVQAQDTTAPDEATNVVVAKDGNTVTGNAEPGSTVTIKDADGKVIGTGKADAESGNFSVTIEPAQTNGETLTVVVSDASGNASQGSQVQAQDTTAPDEATNIVVAKDGNTVTGNAEPGSTVTIKDADGKVIGTDKADAESGNFSVTIEPAQTNGETLTVVVSDASGNASQGSQVQAQDTTPPAEAPKVELLGDKNGDDILNSTEVGTNNTVSVKVTIPENVEIGNRVVVTGPDGKVIEKIIGTDVNPGGELIVSVAVPERVENIKVEAVIYDAANNFAIGSDAIQIDVIRPELATQLQVSEEGTTVTGNAEPGSTVTIKDADGKVIGTGKADAESGNFSVVIEPAQTNGETLSVVVIDNAKNTSDPATVTANGTAEEPSSTEIDDILDRVELVQDQNGDKILSSKELGDDAHFATVKIHLKDGAKAGDMVVVNGANGFALTATDIENGFVEVPVLVREGENPLNIIAYNAEGQKDQLDESFSFTVDTEAPGKLDVNPIEDVAKDEAITISGTADPGSTITVKLPNGETSTTQATDGTWSIVIPADKAHDIADGEVKVTVEASDEAGNIASKDTSFNLDTQTPTVELAVDKSNGTVSLSADEDLYLNGNKVYDKESNTITDFEVVKKALGDQVTIKDGQLLVDPNVADDITLTLDNISDKAGNATSANATLEARPTVTVKADTTALTADTNSTDITFTFSEAVTGFDISDIEVSGGTLSNFHQDSENPFIYHVTFTAEDNNTLNASVAVKDGSYQSVESTRVGKGAEATAFTGDTLAPVAPEIALVKDAGFYDYDGITNISQMKVSNLEEGASWQYSTDGGKTWKNGSGTSFNLNHGEYKVGDIIVKQTDAADNSGEKVFGHDVTIDTVSPDVQIKGFVLSGHSDPVWNLTAGTYKDLLLTGTSEPGSKVELVLDEDDQESGLTAMTDATGKWSIHIPADQAATILNGSSIQVNALDIAGNTVSTSKSVSINEPYEGQVINQINVIAGDDMINVEEARFNVEINGYASKAKWNDLVYFELYNVDKSKPVDNIKFDSTKDNNWTLALSPEQLAQLADGHYRLDVYDDRSGTSLGGYTYSNLLTSREFMIDRSIVAPGAEVDGDKDEAEDKVLVNTVQPTWHNPEGATAEPNAQITIKVDGKVVGSTTSSAEGTWSIKSNSTLADGNHQVEITITDKAGNTATSSQALTVDTQAPQLTVDPITGDNRLSDNEAQQGLTITGTGEAGATILVKVGESEAVETTVNSDGSWAVTVNKDTVGAQVPTEGGDVTVTVTSTDKAGNSTTQDITVGYYQANNLVELSDNGLDQTQSKALNLNDEGVYYLEQPQALLTTSNGDLVQWQGAGTDTLIGMANGKEVIRIHVDNQGSYEVVQHQAVQHGARGSATDYSLNLDVPVYRIADGQTSQQWLTLQIKDAQPELVGQEKALTTADNVIDGQALKAVSPDGLQTFSVQLGEAKMDVDLDTYQATISGGEIFSYRVEQGENPILFLSTKAGETLRLNLKTGEYQYRIPSTDVSEDVYDQPEVNIGGSSSSLLNTVNLNVAGLAKFENQQAFSVQGDGIYSVKLNMWAVDVGGLLGTLLGDLKKWTYNERLAEEFGLKVNVTPMVLGLSPTILTITAKDGSELDTDRVNQLLATVGTEGGLSKILTVGLLPTTWMEAFDQNGDKLDSSYGGTSLANVGLLNDALSGEAESNTFVDVDGKSSTMDHRNATDNLFIYGLDGKDHLVGGSGSDRLYGGQGDDILEGGSESDLLVGGKGNDTLTGGLGSDVFRWEKDDQVSAKGIATDVVTDFNAIGAALGGDVLDLSRLLVGAGQIGETVGNLLNYLHFSYDQNADQTILYISTQGRFIGGFQANNVDQIIQLKGVDLTSLGDNDLEIIETLIAQGSLVVDHIQGEALPTGDGASRTITIGVTDKDGDHQEAKVTADTSGVDYDQNTFNPDNQAPLVFGRENDLLGIIGLDALQILKLNKQDIYVFDPDNNLASVDIRYLQVLGVDVTPSTFGWSEQLAKELGLKVSLENKKGVLGLIAPSVTLHITAQDGGVIDNVKINQFLASVRFGHANSEGILDVVNGDVLSLDLLNGMRITATDYQGAQTEKPLLSLLDLDLLGKNHTLNGDVHLVEGDAEGNDWDRSNSDNSEIIYGYAGDDTITTNHLGNVVYGGTGNDTITGGLGNDNLYGGDGNDTLKSTGGTDYLFGEAGDDQLYGNTSFGTVFVGGSGSDTYHSVAGVRDTVILQAEDLGTGVDHWQGFAVGNMLNADADVLDLSALLQSENSLFDKDRADLLSESDPAKYLEYMQEFIQVESEGGNTTIAIDLDGAHHETEVKQSEDDKNPITVVTGDKYQYSDAITLNNVTSTLDDLLKNQQIIY